MTTVKNCIQRGAMGLALTGLLSLGALAQSGNSGSSSSGSMQGSSQGGSMQSGSMSGSSQLGAADKKFIEKAAQGGMAEVELGKLAADKASSDDVKKFGQRMVDDHSKANDQLKQLAESKGVQVPQDLNAKDKATKDRLSKLSGAAFDSAYMKDMVQDHTKDVSEFRRASTAAKDQDVKSFASQTLPTLEEHLKQAQSIAPKGSSSAKQQTSSMQMKDSQK
jgi:putative membrane protein